MSKTILLADDSLTIQKVVELTFSDTDFELIATSGGDELLERLPSSGADIVICDTIMPGTDGYAVCQAIKSESSTLHIPVILMTGTFEPFDRDRALAAGCSEIITKPFEARNLVETVERLVSSQGVAAPAPEPFDGSVAPPDFSSTVQPPAQEQAAADFGTMLSPPPDLTPESSPEPEGEGLDFTATGFAEMEAAGADSDVIPELPPEEGLEFEASTFEASEVDEIEPAEPEPTQPIPTGDYADGADPFDAAAPGMFGGSETAAVEPAIEEPTFSEPEPEPEPFEAPAEEQEFQGSIEVEVHPPEGFPVETDPVPEPEPEAEFEPEPEPAFEPEPAAEPAFIPEPVTEPELVPEPVAEPEPSFEPEPAEEIIPEVLPEQDSDSDEVDGVAAGQLSDADVDRIAQRVVELAADRLEKIAWDVIPDMAEIIVRERLRELEDEIERSAGSVEPN